MAGSTITSHPAGTRRKATTRRRPSPNRRPSRSRRPAARRRPAVAGSRKRKRARGKIGLTQGWKVKRWWPALVVIAAVLVGAVWDHRSTGGTVSDFCEVADSSLTLTTEQVNNAVIIAGVARDRGLPERALVIALATAQQESRLRNLDYGDRDSLGLFQQRPSSGWGTPAQVQDPVYAAGKFFDHLVQVPGWETGRLTDVSQAVQRSGFPEAYQQWEPMATELAAVLVAKPTGAGAIDCT